MNISSTPCTRAMPTLAGILAALVLVAPLAAAADAPPGTLSLTNGGAVPGVLRASESPDTFVWESPSFVSPFEFDRNGVNSVHYPPPARVPLAQGEYCFELLSGDVLFGELISLGDDQAEIDTPRFGRLRIERSRLQRIFRWRDSADLMYIGPNGLAEWDASSTVKEWREEGGQVFTDRKGATLLGKFKLPPRASIELEVSWKQKPDFLIALGVTGDPATIKTAFRFEVWAGDLVIQRETDSDGDVSLVQSVAAGAGRAHVIVYLDQEAGRCLVYSPQGERLADLTIAPTKGGKAPASLGDVFFENKGGDMRIERLRIGRWSGDAPREVQADKSRVHLTDGSIVYGRVKFDPQNKQFLVAEGEKSRALPVAEVSSMILGTPSEVEKQSVRAVYQDGCQVSGDLLAISDEALRFELPGVRPELTAPIAGLRSVIVVQRERVATADDSPMLGNLEMDGVRLPGALSDGKAGDDSSCLCWKPQFSRRASALVRGSSGRIVYREPPPQRPAAAKKPAAAQQQRRPVGWVDGFVQALGGNAGGGNAPARRLPEGKKSLILRTGDTVVCDITGIDENGVHFKSDVSDATFVPNEKIKAIELAVERNEGIKLTKTKRERLLTLPRMQKDSPPTHLIWSTTGDMLRGRVVGMNAENLQVEIHLENQEIPRARIARIIWLHADELAEAPAFEPDAERATRVQTIKSDGIRMTFQATQFADNTLSGKSDVLGACRVGLKEVDQLLFGRFIEQAAAKLAFQQWKLQNAIEPKFVTESDSGDGPNAGIDSPLVGKPAPDFKLDLLGGGRFQLSEMKGKIVVLDFWATWCGPCLQSMPIVENVCGEFRDRDVHLIAVNLEEMPKQINAMLERQKLKLTVALDVDGTAAARYSATSIPQTVIIDRDGNVARLFVGTSNHFADDLRTALQSLFPEAKAADAPANSDKPSEGSGAK